MVEGDQLKALAGVQGCDLVDAALLEEVGGVVGPGGAVVVDSVRGVEGGAGQAEIELGLAGVPSPIVGEAVENVFEDEAVVEDHGVSDRAGGGAAGAASSQAPLALCQRWVVVLGGRRRSVGVEW